MFVVNSKAKFRFSLYTSRPSARQWSLIPLSHWGPLWGNGHRSPYIKTLCEVMVINLFTSRPFTRQCSSISLHQDPLQSNGHWFLMSHQGPLRGNGYRSPYIKTLFEAMVIDFLCHIKALYEAMVIDLFTSRPSVRQWSLISLSDRDPLRDNGH